MIIRIVKTLFVTGLVYVGVRKGMDQSKILTIREEAKKEMERARAELKELYNRTGEYATMSDEERARLFDIYVKQMSRWTRIHAKTF